MPMRRPSLTRPLIAIAMVAASTLYHYSCIFQRLLNRWATMIREIMDGWSID